MVGNKMSSEIKKIQLDQNSVIIVQMKCIFCRFDPGTAPIASQEVQRLKQLDQFVTPQKGCSIADGFHFLHFPLNESYVRERVFTHTHICQGMKLPLDFQYRVCYNPCPISMFINHFIYDRVRFMEHVVFVFSYLENNERNVGTR